MTRAVRAAVSCIILTTCQLPFAGCTIGGRQLMTAAVLSDDTELVSTQMLKPGVEGRACAWSAPWTDSKAVSTLALRRALEQAPDATLLEDARVEAGRVHLGLVVRDCVKVSGDATRRIGQVVLPMLGNAHEAHH